MGTSNFCRYDARKIYAVISEDDYNDKYLWEDTREFVSTEIEKMARKHKRVWIEDDKISDLSYPSVSIGYYRDTIDLYGLNWEAILVLKTVSGYYTDFSIDYDINFTHDLCMDWIDTTYDDYEDDIEQEINEIIKYVSEYLSKDFIEHKDKVKDKFIEFINTLRDEVESVFEKCSTPLEVFASFSNGETLYTRA